jgi:hypothetical protein
VKRYLFSSFDFGSVSFFANLGPGDDDLFRDKGLSVPLLAAGFLQFGKPSTGHYDPVCFDPQDRIVMLDHEDLLQHSRIEVITKLANSFLELIEA